jgi:hypothetical protein
MKKGFFSKMKNWFKDYYKELSVSMKQDKTLSNISWGIIIAGAFTSFAFMLANPAGGPFMLSALLTGVAFADMYSNIMQGNNTSYLTRGIMYVGMTALAPVVAAAEYGLEKLQEHRENKRSAEKGVILDKSFEADTKESTVVNAHESNTSEFVSQRHSYDESISQPHSAHSDMSNDDITM